MTKSKHTKRALLVSVLSMLLCLSMLVGSTFAWFTDSVTSGKNKIVAGNLDVELEYSTNPADETSWTTVEGDTNLFQPTGGATKWEPGHTEVVYLRIRNAGSLALKYQFSVNVFGDENGTVAEKEYTNMSGDKFKLSNNLVFTQADGTNAVTNREDLWLPADEEQAAMGNLSELGLTGELKPAEQKSLTLAVYMPTQVGNEANQLTSAKETEGEPTIYLGLNLVATQTPHEEDSFGKDYDKNAWLEASMTDNQDGTYTGDGKLYVKDNGGYVEVTESEATKGLYTAVESGDKYVANEAALTAAISDPGNVTLIQPIQVVNTSNDYFQDPTFEFTVDSAIDFNEKTISIESASGKNGIVAGDGVTTTLSNGTITMDNSYGSSYPVIHADAGPSRKSEITLDHMTVELTADEGKCVSAGSDGGKVVIKDSTIKGPNSKYANAVYTGSQSTLEFENSVIIGSIRAENNGNIIIRSGDFTQADFYFGGSSGKRIVYAGTFAANPKTLGFKLAEGSTATDNGNGTWTVTAG